MPGEPAAARIEEPADGARPVQPGNVAKERNIILVVDDEEFILLLAQQVLTDAGYRVLTARHGVEAVAVYRQLHRQMQLVILDLMMPGMSGVEVFNAMQEVSPEVPVVLSSGVQDDPRVPGLLARGLQGFFPKPYTQAMLLQRVQTLLAKAE